MDHKMVFTLGCGRQQNQQCKKYTYFAGNFDHHADVLVQSRVHHPIAHIHGFTRSHWMLLLGECPRRTAPAATKIIDFGCKHKNTNKTHF
jgi:hypothetical protein